MCQCLFGCYSLAWIASKHFLQQVTEPYQESVGGRDNILYLLVTYLQSPDSAKSKKVLTASLLISSKYLSSLGVDSGLG